MCYFEENNITDEKKRSAIFFSVVGAGDDIYTLLKRLVAPKYLGDIKLDKLLKHLENHFTPETNTIVERYRFNKWTRRSGLSIKSCIAERKDLVQLCQFGKTQYVPN